MSIRQQIIPVFLLVGVQLALFILPQYFPYPFFVKDRLFFLVYTTIFFGGLSLGIPLGLRNLPLIVLCLLGTILFFGILTGMLSLISGLLSQVAMVPLTILTEQIIPTTIWTIMGGICGSLLHGVLRQSIGMPKLKFKFALYVSNACTIIIILFGVVAEISSVDSLIFVGAPLFFVGVIVGLITTYNAVLLAGSSQAILTLFVALWLAATTQGEASMIVPIVLFMIPISFGCGAIGALYGKYLRNHFLEFSLYTET